MTLPSITSPPSINGHRYDFSSIIFSVGVKRIYELKDLSYKQKLAPGKIRGTGSAIRGRTRGIYDADGSFTMYKTAYQDFITELMNTSSTEGIGYMEMAFDITVSYAEAGSQTIVDSLLGCRITDDDDSHSEGGEAAVVKATLDIFRVLRQGSVAVIKSAATF